MLKRYFLIIGIIQFMACCFFAACNSTQLTQESKMEKVKIINIPAGKMVKTTEFRLGDDAFFNAMQQLWINVVDRHTDIFSRDFLAHNDSTGKHFWLYSILGLDIAKFNMDGFEIIDFEGGYFATSTAIDPDDGNNESLQATIQEVRNWVNQSKGFELDFRQGRYFMTQMPIADNEEFKRALGYYQLEIFIPVKIKK